MVVSHDIAILSGCIALVIVALIVTIVLGYLDMLAFDQFTMLIGLMCLMLGGLMHLILYKCMYDGQVVESIALPLSRDENSCGERESLDKNLSSIESLKNTKLPVKDDKEITGSTSTDSEVQDTVIPNNDTSDASAGTSAGIDDRKSVTEKSVERGASLSSSKLVTEAEDETQHNDDDPQGLVDVTISSEEEQNLCKV
ncbi:hypothetical protein EDL79_01950 [Ehrlichia ruminantium]|uniref:Uncharacterized protein n=1 Tax=Ehrlichia ruminantium TaxID=779 RepID=A0AAE6QA15_EHRRU|nr:hypothetical protein [Ehrlichia ruminantium]QGR02430.1 hypothetical protein EDL81_01955 [Ehrlichia ruminantium]QGR03349.1 hypothetical protein EDL80_01950 [Ehrlichia ruminantium]QGR04276.1 hypothetical protein EDL79_01950 [Ehrlichia ruminantium]